MDLKRKHEESIDNIDSTIKRTNNEIEPTQRTASLNCMFINEDSTKHVFQTWGEHAQPSNKNDGRPSLPIEIILEPYKLCVMKHFLSDTQFLHELKRELMKLELIPKCNDLYQYHQSADLSVIHLPAITSFKEMMMGQCRQWMESVTGKKLLKDKITLNCSTYNYTDHLLCHDDQTEDRLIAFVFYLNSEKWTEKDGGQLQIFDSDEHQQPRGIVKSILPEYNSFVFFEVTHKSFHQVSEVLTADRTRLSINGWYHGVPNPAPTVYYEPDEDRLPAVPKPKSFEMNVMNQLFLAPDVQTSISNQFEEMNEILLTPFLNNSQYLKIMSDLQHEDICWKFRGPANRRRYEVADLDSLPDSVKNLVDFFQSEPMFGLLQKYTNLDLESSTGAMSSQTPTCYVEVQRWSAGCYTLLHDNDRALNQKILDASLYFEPVAIFQGGFTSYIARDDDEELLTVAASQNGLALTYRDEETLRFVKYVNCRLGSNVFHTISLTYKE